MTKKVKSADMLLAIEAYPNSTAKELNSHFPDALELDIHRCLYYIWKVRGKIVRSGKPYRYNLKPANHAAIPAVKPPAPLPLASDKIKQLQAEIDILNAWKADAIVRYPELGVEPIVIQARKIAASVMPDNRHKIMRGDNDTSPMLLAIIMALEAAT